MPNPSSKNFFDSLKNDPKKIITWCESEIRAYKELIALIKKETKKK